MEKLIEDLFLEMWERIAGDCIGETPIIVAFGNDDDSLEIREQDQAILDLWEVVKDLPRHKGKEPITIILPDGMRDA